MDLLLALPLLALATVADLPRRRLGAVCSRLRRLWAALREFNATQIELAERQELLHRPWEEDFLHWSHDGRRWQLHGHLVVPSGHRSSTTREGWCPARRRARD